MDQQDFPATKLRERHCLAICHVGQGKISVQLTHSRRVAVTASRRGRNTKTSASQGDSEQEISCHSDFSVSQSTWSPLIMPPFFQPL